MKVTIDFDKILQDKQESERIREMLLNLIGNPGWDFYIGVINKNIDFLREQLEAGFGDNDSLEKTNNVRSMIKNLKDCRDTVDVWLKRLEPNDSPEYTYDPYPKIAEQLDTPTDDMIK